MTNQTEIEAAAFRRLIAHLQNRVDAQNIDLMNLAGFCRNCLSRWLVEEAEKKGVTITKEAAQLQVYGQPYADWKQLYQREASAAQLSEFQEAIKKIT